MPVLKETPKATTLTVEQVTEIHGLMNEIGKANRIAALENMVGADLGARDAAFTAAMQVVQIVGVAVGALMSDAEREAEERGELPPIDNPGTEVVCHCPLCEMERSLGLK